MFNINPFKRVNKNIVEKYKNIFLQSKNAMEASTTALDLIVNIKSGKLNDVTEEEIKMAHKEAAEERFNNFMDSKEPLKQVSLKDGSSDKWWEDPKQREEFNKQYQSLNDPINRAATLESEGFYDQAISLYNQVLLTRPNDINAYIGLAFSCCQIGKYEQSWINIHKAEALGYKFGQEFLENLKKLSGRDK